MDEKQLKDLVGFLTWALREDSEVSTGIIITTVLHDLVGLYQKDLCFSPRSSGYAKHVNASTNLDRMMNIEKQTELDATPSDES